MILDALLDVQQNTEAWANSANFINRTVVDYILQPKLTLVRGDLTAVVSILMEKVQNEPRLLRKAAIAMFIMLLDKSRQTHAPCSQNKYKRARSDFGISLLHWKASILQERSKKGNRFDRAVKDRWKTLRSAMQTLLTFFMRISNPEIFSVLDAPSKSPKADALTKEWSVMYRGGSTKLVNDVQTLLVSVFDIPEEELDIASSDDDAHVFDQFEKDDEEVEEVERSAAKATEEATKPVNQNIKENHQKSTAQELGSEASTRDGVSNIGKIIEEVIATISKVDDEILLGKRTGEKNHVQYMQETLLFSIISQAKGTVQELNEICGTVPVISRADTAGRAEYFNTQQQDMNRPSESGLDKSTSREVNEIRTAEPVIPRADTPGRDPAISSAAEPVISRAHTPVRDPVISSADTPGTEQRVESLLNTVISQLKSRSNRFMHHRYVHCTAESASQFIVDYMHKQWKIIEKLPESMRAAPEVKAAVMHAIGLWAYKEVDKTGTEGYMQTTAQERMKNIILRMSPWAKHPWTNVTIEVADLTARVSQTLQSLCSTINIWEIISQSNEPWRYGFIYFMQVGNASWNLPYLKAGISVHHPAVWFLTHLKQHAFMKI